MRARGANARLRALFESAYGTPPSGDYYQLPFVSSQLGAEQGLIESDLLGQGREGFDPSLDVVTNAGDVVVPVDVRAFGYWLMHAFGEPTTTASGAAQGTIKFSAQPANNATITLNGTAFTFTTGSPTGNQIQIGADLSTTIGNAVTALNASAVSGVAQATYSKVGTDTLKIVNDTAGTAGNAYTLVAGSSPASNGTVSGATLGGGTMSHTFTSGNDDLPSMAIEAGLEDISVYEMNYGARLNQLKIDLSRKGLLNATVSLIAKGSTTTRESGAGTPVEIDVLRFAHATGSVTQDGSLLGSVVSASIMYSNNLDPVETIRPDGEIEDADAAMSTGGGNVTVRFADTTLIDKATSNTPVAISAGWTFGAYSLTFTFERCFLPRAKRPITGPAGIQAAFDFQASGADGTTCSVVLVNDVDAYELP